jgi:hypothetical protein
MQFELLAQLSWANRSAIARRKLAILDRVSNACPAGPIEPSGMSERGCGH